MKTNVPIELSDEERNRLANVIDGKPSKRLATRAEVIELAAGAVRQALAHGTRPTIVVPGVPDTERGSDAERPAPEPAPVPPVEGTPTAIVDRDLSIPCERPTTENDFPVILADWYERAKRDDSYLHAHIVWDAERRGIRVQK